MIFVTLTSIVLLGSLPHTSLCDIYLHNPRGSNNRLNENGREVQVNKRLFDSQNNNRGGYNVGNMYYLSGSKLQIEWTAQHSCADPNNHCTVIIQYMCSPNLRDGAVTGRIPKTNSQCRNSNCTSDIKYGMHEDNEYYLQCQARKRNNGLFTADQILRQRATSTRQNPGGTQYGYECPEERDYYPYWYSSPWKDIAVLTSNPKRCKYYREESANVKSRSECRVSPETMQIMISRNQQLPTNKTLCENVVNGTWTVTKPHGIPPPICMDPQWTRDNQLGNTVNGYMPSFNWTIPSGENENHLCALRIRYNISTSDYDDWNTFADGIKPEDKGSKFGFVNSVTAKARGYEFKGNPTVQPFTNNKFKLKLAINTNQYGRVFQDRSHGFFIKPKTTVSSAYVHNVNVRGKRGNIVQVYPSVEYDFTPNTLLIANGDYVHFQWTGSNNNNGRNDGQGRAGSDRNNVLLQASSPYSLKGPSYDVPAYGHWGRSYPQFVGSYLNSTMLGFNQKDLEKLAFSGTNMGDMDELDDAGTYFDLGPRKITMTGVSHYMCTRNNNFSNRSQKGRLICTNGRIIYNSVGASGGTYDVENGKFVIQIPEGAFKAHATFRVESGSQQELQEMIAKKGLLPPSGDGYASDFVKVGFSSKINGQIQISMKVSTSSDLISVYRINPDTMATWERLDMKQNQSMVSFQVEENGIFVARSHNSSNIPLVVGMVILSIVIIGGVGILIYLERQRGVLSAFKQNFRSKV